MITYPKLRTVNKVKPPYPLNDFPEEFPYKLGKEIVYILATKNTISLEGTEWEEIFANCIHAEWKPSNVGLDDIVLGNTAWGAKTIKAPNPSAKKTIRLIIGRNSPEFSFGEYKDIDKDPNGVGSSILEIWNERVSSIREKFKFLRSVVLIKSNDLKHLVVFEFDTNRFEIEKYEWRLNKNHNLEGWSIKDNTHKFTWQRHGSQFTVIEDVPKKKLIIKMKAPKKLDKEMVLTSVGFSKDWITVERL